MTLSTGSGPLAAASNGVYINQYAHIIIADLLAEAGFSSTDYIIEQSLQQPIGYLAPAKFQTGTNVQGAIGSIGYIISSLCEAEMGIAFFDENGTFHFWNRQHIPDNTTSQWTFDYNETAGGNNTGIISYNIENTATINSVIVQSTPRIVAAQQLVWGIGQATQIPANSSIVITSDFSDSDGQLPVTTLATPILYNVANPVSSSYQVNLANDGTSPTDVSSYVSVTSSVLNGSSAVITFSNTYSNPIYITSLALYGTPAKVAQTISQEFKNQTSIDLYGINPTNNGQPVTIQNNLIQDSDTAHSIAYQLVTDYNQPFQRLKVEVMAVPQLQIGDYVTVTLNDISNTKTYTIVGIELSQAKSDPLKQSLELEYRQMVTYFTIGVSHIGSTDQIAP